MLILLSFFLSTAQASTYVVQPNETLAEISFKLYGGYTDWKRIAEWNGLAPPYALRVGQKLELKEPPTLDEESGRERVAYMWQRRREKKQQEPVKSELGYDEEFARGEVAFLDEKYSLALDHFKKCRALKPEAKEPIAFEIRTLRALGRKPEAKQLLEKHPGLTVEN